MTYIDADGHPLDGHNSYTLIFDHPPPAAPFRPVMRLYQPQAAVLDGTYQIPPITKAAI